MFKNTYIAGKIGNIINFTLITNAIYQPIRENNIIKDYISNYTFKFSVLIRSCELNEEYSNIIS